MKILSLLQRFGAGAAFATLSLGVASAGTISTPILFLSNNTNQVVCVASNVSASSVTVNVFIRGIVSGGATSTCTLPASDRGGCQVPFFGAGQCRIAVTGLTNAQVREVVRGVMFTRSTSAPFALEAVVQAQ
jgi:hypothetical protein